MKRTFLILLLFFVVFANAASQKKPVIRNKYILQVDPSTGRIAKTPVVDTIAWLGNGYGLIKIVYKEGGYNPKEAHSKPLDEEFIYKSDKDGNKYAWGIIDTTGKFLLEPVYSSIDLWGNMKGIAYRLEYASRKCGFLYPTHIDLNKGTVKYMGDDIDHAQMIGTGFILVRNMRGKRGIYDSDLKVLKDTTSVYAIYYGTTTKLENYPFNTGCDVAPTFQNIKNKTNPEIIVYDIMGKGVTIFDSGMNALIPEGSYTNLRVDQDKILVRLKESRKEVILDSNLKPVSKEAEYIRFEKGYWVFDDENGSYDFANKDLSQMNPDTLKKLKTTYYEAYLKKLRDKDAERYAKLTNPDLAGYMCGMYARFHLNLGGTKYDYDKYSGDRMEISRVGNSQSRIHLSINAKTSKNEGLQVMDYIFNQSIDFDIFQDGDNIERIIIGNQITGGWYNKETKEIYIFGKTTDGKSVQITSANYNF